jgi:Phage tail tube protein
MAQLVADSQAVAGIAFITAAGTNYRLVGEFRYSPAVVMREPALGMDGIHGYIERPRISSIKARLRDQGGLRVGSFQNMVGIQVTAEMINGKVVSGSNGWSAEAVEVDQTEGTFEIEWQFAGGLNEQLSNSPMGLTF